MKKLRQKFIQETGEKLMDWNDSDLYSLEYVSWLENKLSEVDVDTDSEYNWPLKIELLAGRKRIMLGGAFSSYLSEDFIPVKVQKQIVEIFNKEYHRIKDNSIVNHPVFVEEKEPPIGDYYFCKIWLNDDSDPEKRLIEWGEFKDAAGGKYMDWDIDPEEREYITKIEWLDEGV